MFDSKDKKWAKKGEGHVLSAEPPARPVAPSAPEAPRLPPNVPQRSDPAAAAAAARAKGGASQPTVAAGRPVQPSPRAGVTQQKFAQQLQMLQEMGFEPGLSASALEAASGDIEAAVEAISSGSVTAPSGSAAGGSTTGGGGMSAGSAGVAPGIGASVPPPPPSWSDATMAQAFNRLLDESPDATAALQMLSKLVSNVHSNPDEVKYRRVRLTNAKIGAVLGGGAAVAALQLAGFVSAGGEHAEMADSTAHDSGRLTATLHAIDHAMAKAALPPPLGPMAVKVLAPGSAGDVSATDQLPTDFYEVSGAEVKAAMAAAAARRAQESILRTREQREQEAARLKRVYRKAMIRVRFPDGLTLQGTFSTAATVSLVLQWVSESLRDPAHAFELCPPRGKPLREMSQTLVEAELVPAALLNFLVTTAELCEPPYLRDDLMTNVEVLTAGEQIPQGRPLAAAAPALPDESLKLPSANRTPKWAPDR